jgi:hypothetical protein
LLALLSLILFCLLAATLLGTDGNPGAGFDFIGAQADAIASRFGSAGRTLFLVTGIAVLFSTELALLDAVSRVAADLLKMSVFQKAGVSLSVLYLGVLWAMIGFGIVVLLVGFDRPFVLLVVSAALNGFVMFLYSGLLLWLNWKTFHGPLALHPVRIGALLVSFAFFGYFSALTLADKLGWMGS